MMVVNTLLISGLAEITRKTQNATEMHLTFHPHMSICKVWIYRLLFVCSFVCVRTVTDFSAEDRTVHLLLELLFVKFGYFSVSCLSQADVAYAVDSICIS